jgi:hypothetical protein
VTEPSDSALLPHTINGKPFYRAHQAPAHLATRRQLRADRLSEADLKPVAWLHVNGWHTISALYDRRQARPIRPLTDRQLDALAIGRAICWEVNHR